eukprot:scaffold15099_cov37-Tisochrysis_lutea.AAC.3
MAILKLLSEEVSGGSSRPMRSVGRKRLCEVQEYQHAKSAGSQVDSSADVHSFLAIFAQAG